MAAPALLQAMPPAALQLQVAGQGLQRLEQRGVQRGTTSLQPCCRALVVEDMKHVLSYSPLPGVALSLVWLSPRDRVLTVRTAQRFAVATQSNSLRLRSTQL